MRHFRWAALAALALSGCQGNPPRFDPFLGPATVPPPSTGGATLLPPGDPYAPQPAPLTAPGAPPQSVPYYVPQNSAPTVAPPFTPSTTIPGAAPTTPPVGGFQYRQSSLSPPPGEGRMVPVAATSAAAATVEQASFEAPAAPKSAPASEPPDQAARYGHDAGYQRLRGQLDYSAIDQSWRLRYIPLSGEMDDYGGSVRLREHASLADLQPGEYVEVTGQIDGSSSDTDGFAPWFRVSGVRPAGAK